jgi:hypothetical protein
MSSSPPASTSGPAASAGQRETRSPTDAPLATTPGGEEHPQRKGTVDVPDAPADAPAEVKELVEEAQGAAGKPYEPHGSVAKPS